MMRFVMKNLPLIFTSITLCAVFVLTQLALKADQSVPNFCAWPDCRRQVELGQRYCSIHSSQATRPTRVDPSSRAYGNVTPYTDDNGKCAIISSIDSRQTVSYHINDKSNETVVSRNTITISAKGEHHTNYEAAKYVLVVDDTQDAN